MLFFSPEFLVFLVLLLALFVMVPARRPRALVMLLASWVFYGWWDVRLLPLLWGYTVLGWTVGLVLDRAQQPGRRRAVMWLGVAACLATLGFFKYTNFLLATFARLAEQAPPHLDIILPIGISFMTFEMISYVVDVHDRKLAACRDPLAFALFAAFFPRVISGPIIRPADFLPQLADAPRLERAGLIAGLQLFLLGMFQKVVLADNLSLFVDQVYADPALYTSGTLWLTVAAYSGQIFCDFAGYSLMAIGLARMFGLELPRNFDFPYLSRSVGEFWRRWHISLSSWLRDYLYIRLGGSRGGLARTCGNLILTMLLGGLWHGAGWNFVIWGGLHGLALAGERVAKERRVAAHERATSGPAVQLLHWALTFAFVSLVWVPFRSPDAATTLLFARGLVSGGAFAWFPPQVLLVLALIAGWHLLHTAAFARLRVLPALHPLAPAPLLILALLTWGVLLFAPLNASPFIYFQF